MSETADIDYAAIAAGLGTSEENVRVLFAIQTDNESDMIADPEGDFPRCKPIGLGSSACCRCGRDTRGVIDACPAIPAEGRWRWKDDNDDETES